MHDSEVLQFVLQIDCKELSQFLAPMLAKLLVSSSVSEDGSLFTIDGKTKTIADVVEVSLIASSVPIGIAVQLIVGPSYRSGDCGASGKLATHL